METESLGNGTTKLDEETPLEERLLATLGELPTDLSDLDRLNRYKELLPELAELYEVDAAAFDIVLEATAKKLKIHKSAIRRDLAAILPPPEPPVMEQSNGGRAERGPSQATQLVELALAAGVELFHTPDGEAWATVIVDGHKEHRLIKTKSFRRWLARQFYEQEEKVPGSQALQDALGVLEGKALFAGPECAVFMRIAESGGAIYLDLANEKWEAVEITSSGRQVSANPPVRFRRTKGMLPLPHPVCGGRVAELRPFVNVRADSDTDVSTEWVLLIAWLLMTFSPSGPYPVLDLTGEQGSAKSTRARVLRALTDPSSAPLRTAPREERDLMISAQSGWVLAFDNLSYLPQWLSDAFCRLATGGGFATRELYTDAEEILFDAPRPVLFTAIADVAAQGDLIDRSVRLSLPTIPDSHRKPESKFWEEFEVARPRILGALLDVVAGALGKRPTVNLTRLPRMADFAIWISAAEESLGWKAGTFMKAYGQNQSEANGLALENSPVAAAVKGLMDKRVDAWEGIAKDLLEELTAPLSDQEKKAKSWPKTPLALSNELRRLAPNLRGVGISVEFFRETDKGRARKIRVSRPEQGGPGASVASETSESPQYHGHRRTTPDDPPPFSDAPPSSRASDPIPKDSAKLARERTLPDAADASLPTYSDDVEVLE